MGRWTGFAQGCSRAAVDGLWPTVSKLQWTEVVLGGGAVSVSEMPYLVVHMASGGGVLVALVGLFDLLEQRLRTHGFSLGTCAGPGPRHCRGFIAVQKCHSLAPEWGQTGRHSARLRGLGLPILFASRTPIFGSRSR